jgi:hypothetical protein
VREILSALAPPLCKVEIMARAEYLGKFWWCVVAVPLVLACGGSFATGPDSGGSSAAGGGAAGSASGVSGSASSGAADTSCVYDGKTHADGARFPAGDGCNNCACEAGVVGCTLLDCVTGCESDGKSYRPGQTFERECNTCTCQADGEISCTEIACEEPPGEAACKVAGVIYPSGASGIPDPTSCNKCGCEDGQLSCTEIGCPIECPAGTRYGTQCARCGPTDACEVVEHACLPTCTDACVNGFCSNGICRQVCG